MEPMVTFADLGVDGGAIWSVMVMSGYLRAEAEETGHAISIPNKEMFGVFAKAVTAQLGGKADSYVRAFADAVLSGDAGRMQRELYGIMAESVSVRLLRYEIPYQTLILGLLMHLAGRYRITGDFESGRGYHDIRLESRFGDGPNIVMEISASATEICVSSKVITESGQVSVYSTSLPRKETEGRQQHAGKAEGP